MLPLAVLFIVAPVAITLLIPSVRIAAVTSLIGAAVIWFLIGRFAYVRPMLLNEPEWWAALAIVSTLAGIGVGIGTFMRRRQARPLPHSEP